MECPNCKKELVIRDRVYVNLQSYASGGSSSALTVSDCCGAGFIIRTKTEYIIKEYSGDRIEDDWGEKIIKK